jgi:hypothetical protein
MVKSALVLTISLLLFASHAVSQTKSAAPANAGQLLKVSAEHEAANNEVSISPMERLQQAAIAQVIAERQAQLRRDT